jgi:PAS domain S-box-containing protein
MPGSSSQIFLRFYVVTALLTAASASGGGLFLMYLAKPYIVGRFPAAESGAVLLLGAVGAGVLAGIIGLVLGVITSRRIRELIHRAELLTRKNRGLPLSNSSTDELGALQAAFGRLMISIDRFVRDSDILSHLPQGLLYLGPNGKLVDFNPGAEEILATSLDPYAKKVVWEAGGLLPDGLGNERLKELCEQVVNAEGTVAIGEMEIRLGNGQSRLLEVNLQRWQGSKKTGAVIIFQDASEKQRIREQIRHADQLAFLGGLTAQLAHQVGTPLTVIKGLVELLQKDFVSTDPRQEYIRRIFVGVERINRLVKSLLTLAHPNLNARESISMRRLTSDLLDLVSEKDRDRLQIDCDPSLPAITGDPVLLTEAFTNLIQNALEETSDGNKVSIKATALDQALQVAITNTGVGIPDAIREQIFEPFFTTKTQGTGLGLAITRQLVENHGGRISVDSDGSTWTRFEVELPINSDQLSAN